MVLYQAPHRDLVIRAIWNAGWVQTRTGRMDYAEGEDKIPTPATQVLSKSELGGRIESWYTYGLGAIKYFSYKVNRLHWAKHENQRKTWKMTQ